MARELKELEHDVDELRRDLKLKYEHLETRIMAVEKKAHEDKREMWNALREFGNSLSELNKKTDNLESLADANFMAMMHMLTVIANKLNIPAKDLRIGDRRTSARKTRV